MKTLNSKWVLGHKVTLHETTGNYDLISGETPPEMQGPPPHVHHHYKESFLITQGEMEFFVNGDVVTIQAGESIDIPPKTLHTFANKTDKTCKWVNIHSPKGFRKFFEDVGISSDEEKSLDKSLDSKIISKVIATASDYDMILKM